MLINDTKVERVKWKDVSKSLYVVAEKFIVEKSVNYHLLVKKKPRIHELK
jgi:hypothetical protein